MFGIKLLSLTKNFTLIISLLSYVNPINGFILEPGYTSRVINRHRTMDYCNNYNSKYLPISRISGSRSRSLSIYLINNDLPPPPDSINPTLIDHLLDITIRDKYLGKLIVEKISSFLPRVDTIGHDVLHANNEFIDFILNDTNLSEIMKKKIVLMSIQLAIMGDNMGSTFLQLYYDIVDKCL